ncbi:hypothetical protein RRG08_055746 [Elysia crispata]|uniref:Uncharacterized protein n=1 Tax=Elysia crispata TaxID=231223 RepID=A0AAE1AZS0_9GAST|nr:hypothetical protein RRG08_055746 [Elysia crispata]
MIRKCRDPKWLSVDEVIGLAPVFQGGHKLDDIVQIGLTVSQSLVDRAFTNGEVQNQPGAHPACVTASGVLSTCHPAAKISAYKSCYWMLMEHKFIKCVHMNGLDFVDLFTRCVAAWCQGGDCSTIKTDVKKCEILSGEISEVGQFIAGDLCP